MINLITLFDLIYIAGFLDGDGAIIAQLVPRKDYKLQAGRHKYQIRLSIQFTQLSKRRIYLEKLKDIIGAGYVRDRSDKENGISDYVITESKSISDYVITESKSVSDYVITESKSVLALLKLLQPYLRIKQKQADLAITLIEQLPTLREAKNDKFIELAEIVEQIASLNDTKKTHRKHTIDTI